MESYFRILHRSPLFQGITVDELTTLFKCLGCSFREYHKGEVIYHTGDFIRELGIVVQGIVHIIKDDSWGNSNIISYAHVGEMFAEAFVCGGVGIIPVTVLAANSSENTIVCSIDFQRIIATCGSACVFHTILIRNIVGVIARKNIMLAGKMEHITKRTTREKLLSYLSEQSNLANSMNFDIPLNRQELSDYLSVERSALSAEMSKLRASGVISYRKNHFELHEKPNLK